MKVISAACARRHHRPHIVSEPEPALDSALTTLAKIVSLRHEKRYVGRQPVVLPCLDDPIHIRRLPIKRIPLCTSPPAHAGIVFKGEKLEILQMIARLQIIDKPPQERYPSICVCPRIHVSWRAFKCRSAQGRIGC